MKYRLVGLLSLMPPTWPDMELAIYHQEPCKVFHSGIPKNLEATEKGFFLAGGSSIMNSAINQRKTSRSKTNPKNFRGQEEKPNLFILKVLLHRINVTSRPDDPTIGTAVNTLVPGLTQALNKPENQKRFMRQMDMPSNMKRSQLSYDGGTSRDPRPLEVLGALLKWLQANQIDLYFDWRNLQNQYKNMWIDILRAHSQVPEWQETGYMQGSRQTPTLAALDILFLSVNSE
ncbi:hypothetical protein EJ02DRAFT_472288 [Clathrospora elynae]|uniref:Uncharacterized protein n=1 Tax=Clathrospora elynae TaxID=706981 RepID=A0A6A5T6W7_9PLEO|nr:hypothetical protein EJ02DRAFT_472288 [Clathrospora elynae]